MRRSIDGVVSDVRPVRPTGTVAQTSQEGAPPPRRPFQAPPQNQKRRWRWWRAFLFPLAVLGCLSASFFVQSQPLGAAAIVVYGLVAWFRRLPSHYSFVMAFVALAAVILLLVVRQDIALAGNFSTYAFLLLVVGIASAVRESQAYPKRRNSKIPYLRRKLRPW